MPSGDFTIEKAGSGIYTEKAELNGKALPDFELTVQGLMKGGVLRIYT